MLWVLQQDLIELRYNMINTGIDLVSIERINDILTKNPRFITRFFGNEEQILFESKSTNEGKVQTIAGNFSAKEAFSKALGTGIVGFSLDEVQVLRNEFGAPYIELNGNAKIIIEKLNARISVSISHTDEYATAIVLLEM